jgi:hypothetical protein
MSSSVRKYLFSCRLDRAIELSSHSGASAAVIWVVPGSCWLAAARPAPACLCGQPVPAGPGLGDDGETGPTCRRRDTGTDRAYGVSDKARVQAMTALRTAAARWTTASLS